MRVDFSEWYTRPGLIARRYSYSGMGEIRDTELEVHFSVQAGLAVFTFVNFIISNLDLTEEVALVGSLSPMDGSWPKANLSMMGTPGSDGRVVLGMSDRYSSDRCVGAYLRGQGMHFEVDTNFGERLISLPLPNDKAFGSAYRAVHDQVRVADDAEFAGKDGILGRLNRFLRGRS